LSKVEKENGLYYNYISPMNARWCMKHASIGALGDSFYEYLLKLWIYENKSNQATLDTYLSAVEAIQERMVDISVGDHLTYIGEIKSGRLDKKMDHLACFSGGLFALTSTHVDSLDEKTRKKYLDLAKNITNTCHESYVRSSSGLGPESFHFERQDQEAVSIKSNEKYYILRPEVVESYFYLWRTTKQEKYRDWAWDFVQALEKHCKTGNGYSGVKDVYDVLSGGKDDVQQSFFFAETLKYLFLIFSDDSVLPLDKYVFNSEAHPFIIRK
jgi:mannosyl-oligosaccharide alpha-1,2-mannosidase